MRADVNRITIAYYSFYYFFLVWRRAARLAYALVYLCLRSFLSHRRPCDASNDVCPPRVRPNRSSVRFLGTKRVGTRYPDGRFRFPTGQVVQHDYVKKENTKQGRRQENTIMGFCKVLGASTGHRGNRARFVIVFGRFRRCPFGDLDCIAFPNA